MELLPGCHLDRQGTVMYVQVGEVSAPSVHVTVRSWPSQG